jgi:hypothetical protein
VRFRKNARQRFCRAFLPFVVRLIQIAKALLSFFGLVSHELSSEMQIEHANVNAQVMVNPILPRMNPLDDVA